MDKQTLLSLRQSVNKYFPPFVEYEWYDSFKHSSNGRCRSTHKSFAVALASNGTSENRNQEKKFDHSKEHVKRIDDNYMLVL